MKHLKLGCYSFTINVTELGLTSGEFKNFERNELPDDLKILFDLVQSYKAFEKPVFIRVVDNDGNIAYSGYVHQLINGIELSGNDGLYFSISTDGEEVIMMKYVEI